MKYMIKEAISAKLILKATKAAKRQHHGVGAKLRRLAGKSKRTMKVKDQIGREGYNLRQRLANRPLKK